MPAEELATEFEPTARPIRNWAKFTKAADAVVDSSRPGYRSASLVVPLSAASPWSIILSASIAAPRKRRDRYAKMQAELEWSGEEQISLTLGPTFIIGRRCASQRIDGSVVQHKGRWTKPLRGKLLARSTESYSGRPDLTSDPNHPSLS